MLDPALLPFFFLLLLYVVTFTPHLGRAPEAWTSAVLKILPVWYLAIYVVLKNIRHRAPHRRQSFQQETIHVSEVAPLKTRFVVGLLISSVGDACLVYRDLFKVGILAFGAAQMMYLLALKHRHKKSRLAWVAVPLCITLNAVLAPGIDEVILNILVFGYSLLIHSMLFYAIAGFESFPSKKSFSAMIGACLFIASDFLIALNKWVIVTPYPEASILMTYYTAQLLLTIGIC
ncbi:hypothetical protein RRG08_034269 [Elysia crispata]|uniref:lysoplasmalogenase n=1 Tax=Elysia crispata TaxID=231223 RepID=A0AAE1DQ62_9GAST|nr:hypothetical protein RRG08_034269 [Elysia crispata]